MEKIDNIALTLGDMKPGEKGIVKEVKTPFCVRQRLMDMGLFEGMHVEMIRVAPLGDPINIKVMDTLIAIRKEDADKIIMEYHGKEETNKGSHRHRFGRQS